MSTIVIKISFKEILRRLNVSIIDKKLALDIVMLKAKICSLFNFDSDAVFTMTYVDEDGDTVTLVDDDDLHDIVRQFLNPLRITVSLINNNNNNKSSVVSNPFKPPQIPAFFQNTKSDVPRCFQNHYTSSSTVVNPEVGGSNTTKEKQVQNVTEGLLNPKGLGLNIPDFKSGSFQAPTLSTIKEKNTTDVEKKNNIHSIGPMKQTSLSHYGRISANMKNLTFNSDNSTARTQQWLNAANQCPFSGMPLTSETDSQGQDGHYRGPHIKRFNLDSKGTSNVFHRGVCCDGCDVHPIIGPRFKSKVKDDYDLCSVCFDKMGNDTDYIRYDCPVNSFGHNLTPFKGFYDSSLYIPSQMPPHFTQASLSKLDSRFILDVNVLDGTIMAPFTKFTKVWRMKNNGSIIWPYGSQLQWISGHRLGNSDFVDIRVPVEGFPVDKEMDIAVDFTAPEFPGRYVSYWRMSSPSGQKFGQRVWVSIQVDASMKNLGETSINLNLPPVTSDLEAVNNMFPPKKIFADLPLKDPEMSFPVNDSSSGTATSSVFSPTEVGAALGSLSTGPAVSPTLDISLVTPIVSSGGASPATVVVPPAGAGGGVISEEEEQALVKELEQMGFKRLDLNKEVLRMNSYDLGKSIDDLCGVLEWDPMLDELQEMGFTDDEANRRLPKKNNGSIKRVVMDLINGEKV